MRGLQIFALTGILSGAALCQSAPNTTPAVAPLAFEVATIKPSPPINAGGVGIVRVMGGVRNDGAMVTYTRMTVKGLVQNAYGVKDYQVIGAPWMDTLQFDISAKMPDGASKDQAPEMLQSLLQERFKLTVHHEKKDHAIYALVAGKSGPKLKVAETAPDAKSKDGAPAPPAPGKSADGKATDGKANAPTTFNTGKMMDERAAGFAAGFASAGGRGGMMMRMGSDGAHLSAKAMTLTRFAETLSRFLDRPVVDETGIDGSYDFALDMSPSEMGSGSMMKGAMEMAVVTSRAGGGGGPAPGATDGLPNAPEGGSIFQSIQQYGLKLEPKKSQMDAIMIDSAEKTPTEN